MIAPQPFFEPRGTPFSEFHRIRALTELGHTVDLVTYPFGQDVTMPGLRVFRSLRVPFSTHVQDRAVAGEDPARRAADADRRCGARLATATTPSTRTKKAGVIGVILAALMRVPHVYDMHSSLPQQLTNFAFTSSRAHPRRVSRRSNA